MQATVTLSKAQFGEKEKTVVQFGDLQGSSFLFDSGVHGIRLKGKRTELVVLPYQGQQIWQAIVDGRDITMKSMFTQPQVTSEYLKTYGGFLIHCGVTAMGVPTVDDDAPITWRITKRALPKSLFNCG